MAAGYAERCRGMQARARASSFPPPHTFDADSVHWTQFGRVSPIRKTPVSRPGVPENVTL